VRNSEALYHSLVETLRRIFFARISRPLYLRQYPILQDAGPDSRGNCRKTDFDFFPQELATKYQHDDKLVVDTGKAYETVEVNQPPGSAEKTLRASKSRPRLMNAAGNIVGLQGIFLGYYSAAACGRKDSARERFCWHRAGRSAAPSWRSSSICRFWCAAPSGSVASKAFHARNLFVRQAAAE